MSKLVVCLRQLIKNFDLFPSSQFLRYKQETEFKTVTGGFISMAVIAIFIILFYNLGLQTVNKQIINESITYQIQAEPSPLVFQFRPSSNFMFAIGIFGLNLSDPNITYFNISMRQNYLSPLFQTINSTDIPLVACTAQHFSANQDVLNIYNTLSLSNSLCPPFNHSFVVGGRVASPIYIQFTVYIQYCNSTINPKCISYSGLQSIQNNKMRGSFAMNIPIVSTIVNPGEQDYKQVYVQDRNYYYFTLENGVEVTGEIQQYEIDTDVSLMPYSDVQKEYITVHPNLMQVKPRPNANNLYSKIVFTKSSTSTVYTRSFNKVDDYFSYVGGLVGTLLLVFFFINTYSEKCYLISIASNLYSFDGNSKIDPHAFNLIYFVCMHIKKALKFIKFDFKWQKPEHHLTIMQEMQKQLNISYILRRINFFQEAIGSILDQNQFKILFLNSKKSIQAAQSQRRQKTKYLKMTKRPKRIKGNKRNIISNQSSINNILDCNLQQDHNRGEKEIVEVPPLKRQQSNEQSENTESQKQSEVKLAINNLIQVINQSKQPSPISKRIFQRMKRKIYPQIQIIPSQSKIQMQNNFWQEGRLKQEKEEKQSKNLQNFDFEIK